MKNSFEEINEVEMHEKRLKQLFPHSIGLRGFDAVTTCNLDLIRASI